MRCNLFSAATPTRAPVQPASVPTPVIQNTPQQNATPTQRATESSAKVQKTPANGIEKMMEEKAKITDENGTLTFYFLICFIFIV